MAASTHPLPLTVDEITVDWLTAALRERAPGATVNSFEIVKSEYATCTKLWLRLDLDQAGHDAGIPERVVLKGGFEDHGRLFYQMHEREARGYRDLYPVAHLPHPTCYFADFDRERRQGIIIMEDLATCGATFCNALLPQSFDQVASRLTALARFHASTWNSPEIQPGGQWSNIVFFDLFGELFDRYSQPDLWAARIGLPRGAAMSLRFHDREWMIDAYARMVSLGRRLPQCVIHGDAHLGNVYAYPDGSPGFVDIVTATGPGLLEVAYHISTSVDSADRSDWEEALVQHYLEELARHIDDVPSLEEAMQCYSIFLIYGYFAWLKNEPHHQIEPITTAVTSRINAAMLDRDVIGLIRNLAQEVGA